MKRSKACFLFTALCLGGQTLSAQRAVEYTYSVPETPWEESFGAHRAVLQIDKSTDVAELSFDWRRPDADVDRRCFLIIQAETGDTIRNIKREAVSAEKCKLLLGPIQKGTYYFYYLPYKVKPGYGGYSGGYIPKEKEPDAAWLSKCNTSQKHSHILVNRVESRTGFDSFYPMEVIATQAEKEDYLRSNKAALYLFPEDRKNPIRMRKEIPRKWLATKQGKGFKGTAAPNEYYTFQIGLWAGKGDIHTIAYQASALISGSERIPEKAITCFNLEGIDPYGKSFKKDISVIEKRVQPLWFGIDIPSGQKPGIYNGTITVSDASGKQGVVPISIRIEGEPLADRGDGETWRHSRLRWLNSTMGISDAPVRPYTAMTVDKNLISCLGRTVEIDQTTRLPKQINAWGTDILENSVRFIIRTTTGEKILKATPDKIEKTDGHVSATWTTENDDLLLVCNRTMEFDGWMNYVYTVTPKKQIEIEDIRLEIPVRNEVGAYFLGAGLPGQETPQQYEGKWDTPEKQVNSAGISIATSKQQQWLWPFDSFWIGNAHAGIHCELRGSTYSGPLLNLYRPAYPASWYNGGKGGFSVKKEENQVKVAVYSGSRTLEVGEPIRFDFAMIITPVKPLNFKSQFTDRYYHNGSKPRPDDDEIKTGVRIINVHQGNEYNPFINYPFLTVDMLKQFTKEYHQKGCKVKLYYTLRELSNATTEIWAIRSLGDEILRGGDGGGFPWCSEHFVTDYTPQWYEHFDYVNKLGITADASILTSERDSRWYNYYIEGLAWMVRNLDIDGLYLDDVSFDRRILKRMRRAMEDVKPGCLIDLHSNTGFSKGPANQYTEFLPYIDKLWFGESFLYNKMSPANWLVESSGIPFGLTGDMLYQGGNAWLGMQYGMTVRYPWFTEGVNCDPRPVWKVWDDFNIADATVLGFWEKNPAVVSTDDAVKVTAYRKSGKVLLSLGNYSDKVKAIHLNIDWKQLGLDPKKVKLMAPEIPTFQKAGEWKLGDEIVVQPRKGWLLYVE